MKKIVFGLALCWMLGSAAWAQSERAFQLLQNLQSEDAATRASAAAELEKLTEKIQTLDPDFSAQATPVFLALTDDPNLQLRKNVLRLMTRLDLVSFQGAQAPEFAVQRLAAAMDVPAASEREKVTLEIRSDATVVLSALGRYAVPLLIEVLQCGYPRLRKEAAESLGRIGPDASEARMALAEAVTDSSFFVSKAAEKALQQIGAL